MALSPIERMIDAACGHTPSEVQSAAVPERDADADSKVLLAVADAAKAWRRAGPKSSRHENATERLKKAVDRWIEIGG